MDSRKIFAWRLPFGDKCDPQCENDLHNAYCMVFPVIAVILVLSLVGFLRKVFIFGFLVRHSVGYQGAMIFSIIAFLAVFIATLRHQKKIIVRLWCRRCPGLEKKPVSDGFMLII